VPILAVLIAALALVLTVLLLTPFTLVMRYRAGTMRRQARSWIAVLNIAALTLSVVLCLTSAALTSLWTPGAMTYACGGLAAGVLLGVLGLVLTRWEITPLRIHFTPPAALVLLVTLVVAARIAYAVWRAWHAWAAGFDHTSVIVADGIRGSLAAAGIVLGYYVTFWMGVLRRVRRHSHQHSNTPS
jgi:hypothetical protein